MQEAKSNLNLSCKTAVVLALAVSLAGCGKTDEVPATSVTQAEPVAPAAPVEVAKPVPKPEDVAVTGVHLGKGFKEYNLIARETNTFASGERVDLAIYSDGSAKTATLRVKWLSPDGTVIGEESKEVVYNGSQITPFSLAVTAPLAAGDYRVEVYLNDWQADTAGFSVR